MTSTSKIVKAETRLRVKINSSRFADLDKLTVKPQLIGTYDGVMTLDFWFGSVPEYWRKNEHGGVTFVHPVLTDLHHLVASLDEEVDPDFRLETSPNFYAEVFLDDQETMSFGDLYANPTMRELVEAEAALTWQLVEEHGWEEGRELKAA
jgi:hypothetical protein